MDHIVELPPLESYNLIFVLVDRFTKMATPLAPAMTDIIIQEVMSLHDGVLYDIDSLRKVQLTFQFWQELCKKLKIHVSLSSG